VEPWKKFMAEPWKKFMAEPCKKIYGGALQKNLWWSPAKKIYGGALKKILKNPQENQYPLKFDFFQRETRYVMYQNKFKSKT